MANLKAVLYILIVDEPMNHILVQENTCFLAQARQTNGGQMNGDGVRNPQVNWLALRQLLALASITAESTEIL